MRVVLFCLLLLPPGYDSSADQTSCGPTGINSQNIGLTGQGVGIGQVELYRPGKHNFDNASNITSAYDTFKVFNVNQPAAADFTGLHSVQVAGIMISNPTALMSVAPNSKVYASTLYQPSGQIAFENWPLAYQKVSLEDNSAVRAINISSLYLALPDATSIMTLSLDWSSRSHDVLYVVGRGNETDFGAPADSYNAIVVAASEIGPDNVYQSVWQHNSTFNHQDRRLTCVLAPGVNLTVTNYDINGQVSLGSNISGTSYATPHVTGLIALLQEFVSEQGWGSAARRHEVMKAIVMNSADKLLDNGNGQRLCMEKDIIDLVGQTGFWTDSDAYGNPAIPLDNMMGTGQVNASRAVKQFSSGQRTAGGNVPLIGWDYGTTTGIGSLKKYILEKPLREDSFIAITLAWDRVVELNDANSNGSYDAGETFTDNGLTNLNIYLVPKNGDLPDAVASSISTNYSVEHIFHEITTEGEYEIWVHQVDAPVGNQTYGLAWWAVPADGNCPADLNDSNAVDNFDLFELLEAWGPNCGHIADLTHNGVVDTFDMFDLLDAWGQCCENCPVTPSMAVGYSWTANECHYEPRYEDSAGGFEDLCSFDCPSWNSCDLLSHVNLTLEIVPDESGYCEFRQFRNHTNVNISGTIQGGQRVGNKIRWTHNHPTTQLVYEIEQWETLSEWFDTAVVSSYIFADSLRTVPGTPGVLVTIELDCQTGKWAMTIGNHGFPGFFGTQTNDCGGLDDEDEISIHCNTNQALPCLCNQFPDTYHWELESEAHIWLVP